MPVYLDIFGFQTGQTQICAWMHTYMDFPGGEISIFETSLDFSNGEIQGGTKNMDFSTGEIHVCMHIICTQICAYMHVHMDFSEG